MPIISVDPSSAIGPVKPMHAVNNGPVVPPVLGDQPRGNFEEYRAARIPYDILESAVEQIHEACPGVIRVTYDLTPNSTVL